MDYEVWYKRKEQVVVIIKLESRSYLCHDDTMRGNPKKRPQARNENILGCHQHLQPNTFLTPKSPFPHTYTSHTPPFQPQIKSRIKQKKMASTAHRRLLQEYRALTNNPPEGITAGPVSEDDMLYWEALIQGPEGTPFEGGIFPAELKFPKDYPLAPPTMRFLGEVWHPNGT